jgi:hypothetical protein
VVGSRLRLRALLVEDIEGRQANVRKLFHRNLASRNRSGHIGNRRRVSFPVMEGLALPPSPRWLTLCEFDPGLKAG